MRPIKTGLVLLNMGGPGQLDQVNAFLRRLFTDSDIIQLGRFQDRLGRFIADRRTPKIQAQYAQIGGGSPIGRWTEIQGRALGQQLDELCPESAPHRAYIAFRYADPLTTSALQAMANDGVERAVAFSQYPQYSCTTSGSSFNHLWASVRSLGLHDRFRWSLIDRWPTHPGYIASVAECVRRGLNQIPAGSARDQAVVVFSSHSLPLRVIERGDQYAQEMAATVQLVMQDLGYSHSYIHAWQSKVGWLPWIGPNTGQVLRGLGQHGHKHVVVVPIGFTSDHVETLYELDIEYAEVAKEAGIEMFVRAPSLNDSPLFLKALADIAADHLRSDQVASRQYGLPCAQCSNPRCRQVVNPIDAGYRNLRQMLVAK